MPPVRRAVASKCGSTRPVDRRGAHSPVVGRVTSDMDVYRTEVRMTMKKVNQAISMVCALAAVALLAWQWPPCKSAFLGLLFRLRGRTGVLEYFRDDGTRSQVRYVRDSRDGIWRTWDKNGKLISQCEYRDGEPWDGVCQIRDMKTWLAEYRQGKPWNGALSPFTGATNGDCFIDGQEVSMEEYRKHFRIPPNARAVGIQTIR